MHASTPKPHVQGRRARAHTRSYRGGGALAALLGLALAATTVSACSSTPPPVSANSSLSALRDAGRGSGDGEDVGRWALGEMTMPGGDGHGLTDALSQLAKVKHEGLYGSLAMGVGSAAHGEPKAAAAAFVATLKAASQSDDPDASLVGWYAATRLHDLRAPVANLYDRYRSDLERLMAHPGSLGWRAVAELVEWSTLEALGKPTGGLTGEKYDAWARGKIGCAAHVRLAGPFGRGTSVDRRRSFPAERPGPWPPSWEPDPTRGTPPHIVKVEQHRCLAASSEQTDDGVFYAETYFSTPSERDLIVAAQGAVKVWVDDVPVVERDLREWGVWQRYGALVRVGGGRHRVLARVLNDASTIRLLNPDGTGAGIDGDLDASRPYGLVPPRVIGDPNPLDGMVRARRAASPLQGFLGGLLAHMDGMDDVGAALIDPFVAPTNAAPVALAEAGELARGDASYPDENRRRNERAFRVRAVAKDPDLWFSRAWIALDDAEQRGLVEGVEPLRKLADRFKEEPEILEGLARLYGRLGWQAERMRALADLSKRFPDDVGALRLYLSALEDEGPVGEADSVAARIKQLDPEAEVDLDRALERHDWKAAIAELERLQKRRPDRKDIAGRIADVLSRAGDPSAAAAQLEKALTKNPDDTNARFRLADHAFAKGDTEALRRALAGALQAGASGEDLRDAISLVEGATYLEPYRIDGRAVIHEFEQWEKKGKHMDGNAARVLDYSALWIHPDGSSEMLEHEIQRIQSQEAIGEESEQAPPSGLVLRMRVIKPDGSILEPEPVAGKPTLTMPHLEVGDYVEIEHVSPTQGDGEKGKRYRGPQWFFREADKGYWRSEFVVLSPKDRPLQIETRGQVPAPKTSEVGTFVERRWRVDESPPAPDEPDSVRPQEFLPSVRIGWGISLEDTLRRLVDIAVDETPLDPRLGALAQSIVKGVPASATEERTRRAYRYVLTQIEDGNEGDGRRVLTGKSGSRQAAFLHLLRQLHIPVEIAVAKNRLAMPALGPMSEVEMYDGLVLRVETNKGVRWLTARDKFAPFGYLPAELRGEPAIRLIPGTPRETTPQGGAVDGLTFQGRTVLKADGSGRLELDQVYSGKLASSMRSVFDKVPASQLHDFVEGRLLGRNFPGARLRDMSVLNKEDFDKPLVLKVVADVPQIARPSAGGLTLKALFPLHIAQLAQLPTRQTPLLIGTSSHVEVKFEVVVPDGMRLPTSLPSGDVKDGERIVKVHDVVHGHAVYLDRVVDIPEGRVHPGAEYSAFQRFTQEADALVERDIQVGR